MSEVKIKQSGHAVRQAACDKFHLSFRFEKLPYIYEYQLKLYVLLHIVYLRWYTSAEKKV